MSLTNDSVEMSKPFGVNQNDGDDGENLHSQLQQPTASFSSAKLLAGSNVQNDQPPSVTVKNPIVSKDITESPVSEIIEPTIIATQLVSNQKVNTTRQNSSPVVNPSEDKPSLLPATTSALKRENCSAIMELAKSVDHVPPTDFGSDTKAATTSPISTSSTIAHSTEKLMTSVISGTNEILPVKSEKQENLDVVVGSSNSNAIPIPAESHPTAQSQALQHHHQTLTQALVQPLRQSIIFHHGYDDLGLPTVHPSSTFDTLRNVGGGSSPSTSSQAATDRGDGTGSAPGPPTATATVIRAPPPDEYIFSQQGIMPLGSSIFSTPQGHPHHIQMIPPGHGHHTMEPLRTHAMGLGHFSAASGSSHHRQPMSFYGRSDEMAYSSVHIERFPNPRHWRPTGTPPYMERRAY